MTRASIVVLLGWHKLNVYLHKRLLSLNGVLHKKEIVSEILQGNSAPIVALADVSQSR